jgi:REP element-mobilizing transposase RayT
MSSLVPIRKTGDLRKGRVSIPGARYFITCTCVRPADRLTSGTCPDAIFAAVQLLNDHNDISQLAATIMPDHVHPLLQLGQRLSVSRVISKLKAHTKPALERTRMTWQQNFFEHRLRAEDELESFARYMFLNPYRAGLITTKESWPFWRKRSGVSFDFESMLIAGRYPPETWITEDCDTMGLDAEWVGGD